MDISTCSYDFLPGTDLYFYQHPDMFHVNTDTALLGHFMEIRKKDVVMDIGTNNGALLLYAMRKTPKQLIGVEVNKEACELAVYNLNELHHANATILCENILQLSHESVSCIVCNPPYFQVSDEKQINHNDHLARARHETQLHLEALLKKISSLLHDKGRLYMIHRGDRLIDLCVLCRKYQLEIKKLQIVYDENKSEARSILFEAMKQGKPHCHILEPIIIKRDEPIIKATWD